MRKPNYYNQTLQVLHKLHTTYPQYNMGRHLATAIDDLGDLWAVKDEELLHSLVKYMDKLDMDVPREEDADLAKIIKQGMDLDNILKDEEEE